jgi:hypothetical protein
MEKVKLQMGNIGFVKLSKTKTLLTMVGINWQLL